MGRSPARSWLRRAWVRALVVALVGANGCGGESNEASSGSSSSGGPTGCNPGERTVGGKGCVAAGVQDDGCNAGELAVGGVCTPAGVQACGTGFVADGANGCTAVLPADACPAGSMATPGETACHTVGACANGTFGDAPNEPSAQYVDASYAGGSNDGSQARPWTTLNQAIAAAAPGALVAIAAGVYAENVIPSAPVRLWGRCPALVEIAGTGASIAAIAINAVASGSTLHGIALRGGAGGVALRGAELLVENVWIHDTAGRGIDALDASSAAQLTVLHSLIESTTGFGVSVIGSEAMIESSLVRDTQPNASDLRSGSGMVVQTDGAFRGKATVRGSLLERNHEVSLLVMGADASVESSVVRDTQPRESDLSLGIGIHVQHLPSNSNDRASTTVNGSIIERNRHAGITVVNSEVVVTDTVIRDTAPQQSDGTNGSGIDAAKVGGRASVTLRSSVLERNHTDALELRGSDIVAETSIIRDTQPRTADDKSGRGFEAIPENGDGSSLVARGCVFERNRDTAIFAIGSTVTIDGCAVRDTQPDADGAKGWGFDVHADPATGLRSALTIGASVVDTSREVGVLVTGADLAMTDTVVRATQPGLTGAAGAGVLIQSSLDVPGPTSGKLRGCVIVDNREVGIGALDAQVTIDATLVSATGPRASDGIYGDGICVSGSASGAAIAVTASRIEGSKRAGISNFGGVATLANVSLDCNSISLDGETMDGLSPRFADGGGNVCSCDGAQTACQVATSALASPDSLTPNN